MKIHIECEESLEFLLTEGLTALLAFKQVDVVDDTRSYYTSGGKYSSSMHSKYKQIAVYEMSYSPYNYEGVYDPSFRLEIYSYNRTGRGLT